MDRFIRYEAKDHSKVTFMNTNTIGQLKDTCDVVGLYFINNATI